MKTSIRFGIYTSFYNCERFVDKIFTSIEALNYDDFEWHITDDFSNDNTKNLVLDRLEKSPLKHKIKYYEQLEKKQMYWKPNEFFDETFEWIVLVDSDDDFDKNFLNVYNTFLNEDDTITLVSSDFIKIDETNNSLYSMSYVLNDDIITKKIDRYHPSCDYLNNLSYSCYGVLRGFKNIIPSFEVTDMLACAEDSYHVFWSNSFGKYLHIPRPLYVWYLRGDSESHNKIMPPNFNDNFDIALDKLKQNDGGIDKRFNDVYIETSTIGSYEFGKLKNIKISLWTRSLPDGQKELLKKLYYESNLVFNDKDAEIHLFALNYFNEDVLNNILETIKGKKMMFYYQNQNYHETNEQKDQELQNQINRYTNIIGKHTDYSWWKYIRHFIINT